MMVVGLVLLIACSNVANLLLARASSRRQEMAIRLALGAGRRRIVRSSSPRGPCSLPEAARWASSFGMWGRNVLWSFRPVANNFVDLTIDGRVIAFGVGLSLLTGVVFGIAPAWQASRAPVGDALADARAAGSSGRGAAVRHALVAGQMALSLAALVAGGALPSEHRAGVPIDPGSTRRNSLYSSFSPQQARYDQPRTERLYREVRERLSSLPGVESVSWAVNQPLWAKVYRRVALEGQVQQDGTTSVLTLVNTVDTGYFKTVGRRPATRPRLHACRSTRDARGRHRQRHDGVEGTGRAGIRSGGGCNSRASHFDGDRGHCRDDKYQTLGEAPQACIFVPLAQNYSDAMVLYVRTQGDPAVMLGTIQREVRALGQGVPISYGAGVEDPPRTVPLDGQIRWRTAAAFGVLALALASVGIYGVTDVLRRAADAGDGPSHGARREPSAVRMLRARPRDETDRDRSSVGSSAHCCRPCDGVRCSTALQLRCVSLVTASLMLVLAAVIASYLPARRASRIDPAISLREA